jgi:predicted DNA-binding transcriptional regulator YafY
VKANLLNDASINARLRDLKTVLIWEGQIDNPRVREILGVQAVWASRLIAELASECSSIAYRETSHSPLRIRPDTSLSGQHSSANEYLRVLLASQVTQTGLEDCRKDLSVIDPTTFAMVASAIKNGTGLRVTYRSMSNPIGAPRTLYPHSIVRAPRRWHIRAWCETRKDFRDFNLGRIMNAEKVDQPAPVQRDDDKAWNTFVSFDVVPHPALSEQQRTMIADEYFPGASARKLKMRRCLIGYVIQDLNIATEITTQLPPQFQLCVANPKSILPLFPRDG